MRAPPRVKNSWLSNEEGTDPAPCHDRDILRYNPHSVIEGLAIAGYATNSTVAYNYIRGEFLGEPVPRFEAALAEAYAAGLLGKNVLGSGVDFDLHTFIGAGAYICGEETALLDSLEGKPGKPRSEEHTSELQSRLHLVCRLLLEKKKTLIVPGET